MPRSPETLGARNDALTLPSQPSRRLFLGSTLAAGAFAALPRLGRAEEPGDAVRRFIDAFPKIIPGIRRVAIPVLPGNPKRILGIFEQIHFDHDIPADKRTEVNECQEDLAKAYAFLMDHPDVRMSAMRAEGICAGNEERHMRWTKEGLAKHVRAAAALDTCPRGVTGEEYGDPAWSEYAKVTIDGYTAAARYGAAEVLHCTRGLGILAAETHEAKRAADLISRAHRDYRKIVYAQRERACIGLTKEFREWVTFGASHQWAPLDEHNRANPDDRITAIVLTPESVAKYYGLAEPIGAWYDHDGTSSVTAAAA